MRSQSSKRFWPALSILCLTSLAIIFAGSRGLAEERWWSTLLLYVPQVGYALVPAVLMAVALRRRRHWEIGINLLSLLLVGGPMMGFRCAGPQPSQFADPRRMRVLSYNILGAQADFRLLRKQVERHRPDVVVFSEARHYADDALFQRSLAELFPGWDHLRGGDVYIASRWPILEHQVKSLGISDHNDPSIDRRLVMARVDAPFGRFQVLGVHFSVAAHGGSLRRNWRRLPQYMRDTASTRRIQVERLSAEVDRIGDPVVLCGDFNTPPVGQIYGKLRERLIDAFATTGTGWGFTYPSSFPSLRIDYILCTHDWRVLFCETGGPEGSDHLPVVAELELISHRKAPSVEAGPRRSAFRRELCPATVIQRSG